MSLIRAVYNGIFRQSIYRTCAISSTLLIPSLPSPIILMTYEKWRSRLSALRFGKSLPTEISHRHLLFIRVLAVSSFLANIYSQLYVLYLPTCFRHERLYSPKDSYLIASFAFSTFLNLCWIRQLFFVWDIDGYMLPLSFGWEDDDTSHINNSPGSLSLIGQIGRDARIFRASLSSAQIRCTPSSIVGNIFMALWGYAWANGHYRISQGLLTANLASYLYAVFMLLHVEHDDSITPANYLTHLSMKTSTGLAVLYMWKNWGVIDQFLVPSTAEMINSGVIFLIMTIGSGPDPTVGICLLYDLVALLAGETPSEPWRSCFHCISIAVSICLLVEANISQRNDFSWLKGFDTPSLPLQEKTGNIVLEKDGEHLGPEV